MLYHLPICSNIVLWHIFVESSFYILLYSKMEILGEIASALPVITAMSWLDPRTPSSPLSGSDNQMFSTLVVFATWPTFGWRLVWSNCRWLWTTYSSTSTSTSRTSLFMLFFIVLFSRCKVYTFYRTTIWLGPFRLEFVCTFRIMCIN